MYAGLINVQINQLITATTASLATIVKISAQETTPGHAISKADFTFSIIWNPRRLKFGNAFFSASLVEEFNNTEPSQPCIHIINNVVWTLTCGFHTDARPVNIDQHWWDIHP